MKKAAMPSGDGIGMDGALGTRRCDGGDRLEDRAVKERGTVKPGLRQHCMMTAENDAKHDDTFLSARGIRA
jgi:hypothetical protein